MFQGNKKFPVPGIYETSYGTRRYTGDGIVQYLDGFVLGRIDDNCYRKGVVEFVSALDGTPPLCDTFPIAGVYSVIVGKEISHCERHVHQDGAITDGWGETCGSWKQPTSCYSDVEYVGPLPIQQEAEECTCEKQFWLVWCPSGPTPPSFQHSTELSASKEAERLAKENPGNRFYVLEAQAFCEHTGFEWTVLESDPQDVPF